MHTCKPEVEEGGHAPGSTSVISSNSTSSKGSHSGGVKRKKCKKRKNGKRGRKCGKKRKGAKRSKRNVIDSMDIFEDIKRERNLNFQTAKNGKQYFSSPEKQNDKIDEHNIKTSNLRTPKSYFDQIWLRVQNMKKVFLGKT